MLILYTAIFTISDLEILKGITLVEDIIELFGYKTLDLQKRHTLLSLKSLFKNVLRVSFIY